MALLSYSQSKEIDDATQFIELYEQEYDELIYTLPEFERTDWIIKKDSLSNEYLKFYSEELDPRKKYYENPESKGIYAKLFINSTNDFKLNGWSTIYYRLGNYVINKSLDDDIEPLIQKLKSKFNLYSPNNSRSELSNLYSRYKDIEIKIQRVAEEPEVKYYHWFEPGNFLIQTKSISKEKFEIRNYYKAYNNLASLQDSLKTINKDLNIYDYTFVKDRNWLINLFTQIAILLILIPSLMHNYSLSIRGPVIKSMILLSLIISVLLILISPFTFLNIAVQSLIPGGFAAWYFILNQGQESIEE
ncbi:hypothetical protein L6773_04245 [Rhodohalobacter sp. WB101]|uniref:Uncharacterized protein n=2 Tax=Rhodohalobacter sulfatireducens TaxID=2911366 RepID=A0ABS9KA76_9BACT|nr:hypothetical protein [Rhodohalobacter sulfatireducens]